MNVFAILLVSDSYLTWKITLEVKYWKLMAFPDDVAYIFVK